MIKYGELHRALSSYTREDIHEDIPVDYYRRVMRASLRASNHHQAWNIEQASSVLLYIAFNEGHVHPSQLTEDGLNMLDWAERFLEQIESDTGKKVINALSPA